MRTRLLLLASALLAGSVAAAATPATASTATTCATHWGSLAKSAADRAGGSVTDVRAGRNACFDRMVVDLDGPRDGYSVRYVDNVHQDGSGQVVRLRGGAKLQVVVTAPAYDEQGRATYTPANRSELVNVTGYKTFRQVAWAGSFEGRTTLGLGVRARLPFRVFTLASPDGGSRVVVDVAHSW